MNTYIYSFRPEWNIFSYKAYSRQSDQRLSASQGADFRAPLKLFKHFIPIY